MSAPTELQPDAMPGPEPVRGRPERHVDLDDAILAGREAPGHDPDQAVADADGPAVRARVAEPGEDVEVRA